VRRPFAAVVVELLLQHFVDFIIFGRHAARFSLRATAGRSRCCCHKIVFGVFHIIIVASSADRFVRTTAAAGRGSAGSVTSFFARSCSAAAAAPTWTAIFHLVSLACRIAARQFFVQRGFVFRDRRFGQEIVFSKRLCGQRRFPVEFWSFITLVARAFYS
jgi:hypothetical protein